jgi:hypothetical protein
MDEHSLPADRNSPRISALNIESKFSFGERQVMHHILRMLKEFSLRSLALGFALTMALGQSVVAEEPRLMPTPKETAGLQIVAMAAPAAAPPRFSSQPVLENGFIPAINAHIVAGGGETSSGGSFSLNGTIGQAIAGGPISGGSFSVTSGFWGATQTPSTPPKKRGGQLTSE